MVCHRSLLEDELFGRLQAEADRRRVPLAVTDERHARAGALVGAGTDSHRVGEQLCRLAEAMRSHKLPEGSHLFCPEYSFAVVNLTRAEKLGYMIDFDKVRQVKVYKWH